MILAFLQVGDLLEDVFVVLVGVKFGAIQNTSTRGGCPSVTSSRLLTLKLLDQIVYLLVGRLLELTVFKINREECIRLSLINFPSTRDMFETTNLFQSTLGCSM